MTFLDLAELLHTDYGIYLRSVSSDKHKRTALHVASRQGHEEIVRYLLKDASANPNALDKDEATPLIHAIQVNNCLNC